MPQTALVVGDAGERSAPALVQEIVAKGRPARLVTTAQLATAGWSHRVAATGAASTRITLATGAGVVEDPACVAYLATALPAPRFVRSSEADRQYAAAELHSLVVSWLRGLGARAVNTPEGTSASGPAWSSFRWLVEARAAGLPVPALTFASSARLDPRWRGAPVDARSPLEPAPPAPDTQLLLAGDRVVGALSHLYGEAAHRLAKAARCELLRLSFALTEAGWQLVTAAPPGPLLSAEELRAVADHLLTRRAS